MAVPMLAGTFAMNAYHLTNAYFVSRLGTESLAAISFTFPVVMFFMVVARGLGTGAMTLIAHALGRQDRAGAAALTSHALLFSLAFSGVVSAVGLFTIGPVFTALGARGGVLAQTSAYMKVWYLGSVVMVVQMMTADIIIATGKTKAVSALMVGGTLVNVVFDYGLIFGNLGLPKWGIVGAAVATLLSQGATLCGALYLLRRRMNLIGAIDLRPASVLASWGKILSFGAPGALGMVLTPVASAVITGLVSGYGTAAVAAIGVAGRIEMFAFMIPMTVGMSLIPFVAQNHGAGQRDRILRARRGAMAFAVLYGLFIGALFILFAGPMAGVFSGDPAVVEVLRTYIYLTCAGYGMLEVHRYAGFCLTGTHHPFQASLLNILRILGLLLPLSLIGNQLFQIHGLFLGRLATDLLAGGIGIYWSGRILARSGLPSASPAPSAP
ncbi:MAG: MATE family efflux transporter [Spirochaetes bacterium]|nr:MATE family efflux transporter [Spirochaetota bacterium]